MVATSNGPPKNLSPVELFDALCAQPRPGRPVDLPRLNPATGDVLGQVHMQPLTTSERLEAMTAADQTTRLYFKQNYAPKGQAGQGQVDVYDNEFSIQILFRAMRDAEDPSKPFAQKASQLRNVLTADEVGALMTSYIQVQMELGPIIATMSESEMDEWLARLGEGASRDPLGVLSWEALADLVMHSASRLRSSPTGTGSSISPADDIGNVTPDDDDQPGELPPPDVDALPEDDDDGGAR